MKLSILQGGNVLREHSHEKSMYAEAPAKGEYAVRLYNDSPSRKLAVLSVDGVNVINATDAGFSGPGYVLKPWETLDVAGWRRSDKEVARFEFKPKGKSYAAQTGRGESNVGVIGVAVFDEKVRQYVPAPIVITRDVHHYHDHWPWYPYRPYPWTQPYWLGGGVTCNSTISPVQSSLSSDSVLGASVSFSALNNMSTRSAASKPMPKSVRSASVKSKANAEVEDVGTGYGAAAEFHTVDTTFERASDVPSAVIELRYATRSRLKSWGVNVDAPPVIAKPSAFPASQCAPPPGWNG